jgi:hypothetical protein
MRLRVDIAAKGGKFFANGMSGLAEFFLEGVDGFAGGVGVLCGCSRSLERGLLRSGIHAGGRVADNPTTIVLRVQGDADKYCIYDVLG